MERRQNVHSRPSTQEDPDELVMSQSPTVDQSANTSARHRTRNRRRRRKTKVSAATNIEDCKRRRKLFVGQLPDSISEEQLRLLFVKFGHIIQLKIKRDHENDDSYGLVTYATDMSAQKAQKSLHNTTQLPGTRRPLQVQFVDHLANYRQRKLFVGRIAKHLTETDLISMFGSFGDIEDCAIIRSPYTGLSAGCAFVTFANRESASAAICCLHRSQVMLGWSTSMVVRPVDSRKTKLFKRLDQIVRPPAASVGHVHPIHAY